MSESDNMSREISYTPSYDRWREILANVQKEHIPIQVIDSIRINLIDGNHTEIDIKTLLEQGLDAKSIEDIITKRMDEISNYIDDMDFKINIMAVINEIQPRVDELLQ